MKRPLQKVFLLGLVMLYAIVPIRAEAAISLVGSTENSSTPNTDTTVDLTAITGLRAGDLLFVSAGIGDNDGVDLNMTVNTAGYTKVVDLLSDDTQDTNLGVWWKIMGASPDSSVVVEGSLGGTDSSLAVVVMAFRGMGSTTPMDVASTTATGIDIFSPNPPSINHNNPSGVWTVIAGASGHTLAGAGTYTFPTGYTVNAIDRGHDDTVSDITVGMGYRSSGVSDPEDPGVMTHSGTNTTNFSWAAATFALRPATAPTVTTQDATPIGATSATFNGNITITGDAYGGVTVRGFAWGTSSNMTGDTATTTDTAGAPFDTGAFTDSSQTLICNTDYYYRPYAVNSIGTSTAPISNSFTTSACATPPTATTNFANPGATTATLYGTKTGGEDATQHGFAWGTSATMVGDTATTSLGALASNSSFASGIGGLTAGLTYYFRAYATSGAGTGYGIIRSFVTGNSTASRNMRLFEGFTIKFLNGRIILNQQ